MLNSRIRDIFAKYHWSFELRVREFSLRCVLVARQSDRRLYNSLLRHATGYLSGCFLRAYIIRRVQSAETLLSRCSVSYDNFVDRSVFSCLVSIKFVTQTRITFSAYINGNYVAWRDTARPYRSFMMDHIFLIASGIIDNLHNSASFILHAHEARSIC